jgi:hypothetical protein
MGILFDLLVLNLARSDTGDHHGRADHVGGALLTSGASGHWVLPNQKTKLARG